MNTAGDFSRGDRVEFTTEARAMFVGVATGTVVGFSRNGLNLRIRRDGNVKVVTYNPELWKHSNTCARCRHEFTEAELDACLGCGNTFCEHCLIEHPCGGGRA